MAGKLCSKPQAMPSLASTGEAHLGKFRLTTLRHPLQGNALARGLQTALARGLEMSLHTSHQCYINHRWTDHKEEGAHSGVLGRCGSISRGRWCRRGGAVAGSSSVL